MHLQGPVPLGHASYIERPFERQLIRELQAGRWVLLLGPRQHGKTSALVRIRKTLIENGLQTGFVDLQDIPPCASYSGFIKSVCGVVNSQLNPDGAELPGSDNLGVLFAAMLPEGNSPVVVLIDEASNIPDNVWRNSFYGQLRAISSRRVFAPDDDAAARLRFVFSGTFQPETLIDAANSPFNVCEKIVSDDLREEDIVAMSCTVLNTDSVAVAHAIYSEVGGQPYLVQRLFNQVEGAEERDAALASAIEELRPGESDHVGHLFGKILAEPRLASIVAEMVTHKAIPNEPANPDYSYLQIHGIAKGDGRTLVFRNSLYSQVAGTSPQLGANTGTRERAPIFFLSNIAFAKVKNAQLREIAFSAHTGAVAAYRGGSNRLALAGFGSSLEAILLDLMLRQSIPPLATVVQRAQCRFHRREDANDPHTWSLFNLIRAARAVASGGNLEPPQALREWRNTIHPSVSLRQYRLDTEMEPVVRVAAALHEIVLRDLP
jgi:hypothetical protein